MARVQPQLFITKKY